MTLFNIYMLTLKDSIEILLYHIYIYSALFLAIMFKPNVYTCLALFLYVYLTTWIVGNPANCHNLPMFTKVTVVTLYTLACVAAYLIVYSIYRYYKKYRFLLLLSPFLYLVVVKGLFHFPQCNTYSNINFTFNLLHDVLPLKIEMFFQ